MRRWTEQVTGAQRALSWLLLGLLLATTTLALDWCYYEDPAIGYACINTGGVGWDSAWTYADAQEACNALDPPGGCTCTTTQPQECTQECCCDSAGGAYAQAEMSVIHCIDEYGGTPTPIGQAATCEEVCGGDPGTGGEPDVGALSGHVTDAGDGNAPLEGAIVRYPTEGGMLAVTTDANGQYEIPELAHGTKRITAYLAGCGQDAADVTIPDTTEQDFSLDCSTGGCALRGVNDTSVATSTGQRKLTITWSGSDCFHSAGYLLYRCESDTTGSGCAGPQEYIGYAEPGATSYVDTTFPEKKGLCYMVNAINASNGHEYLDETSPPACHGPMWDVCMVAPRVPVQGACFNHDTSIDADYDFTTTEQYTGIITCNDDNSIQALPNGGPDTYGCDDGLYCRYDNGGDPYCAQPSICDECNTLFGFFLDPEATPGDGASPCDSHTECIPNHQGDFIDVYTSCSEIGSCYEYRKEEWCDLDPCGASSGDCEWSVVQGYGELGRGVCAPEGDDPDGGACERCDELFGSCTTQLCEALGDCYYNVPAHDIGLLGAGEPSGCLPKEVMACAYYDTEEDCVGATPGTPVDVDVTYDSPDTLDATATGGDNSILAESADKLGLGRCAWISLPHEDLLHDGYCVKNANDNKPVIEATTGIGDHVDDDCKEYLHATGLDHGIGRKCYYDNEAPSTFLSLIPASQGTTPLSRLIADDGVRPMINDNMPYPQDIEPPPIRTYACFAAAGESCHPTKTFNNAAHAITEPGIYELYYYSVDPAGNREEVQQLTLDVDVDGEYAHLVSVALVD